MRLFYGQSVARWSWVSVYGYDNNKVKYSLSYAVIEQFTLLQYFKTRISEHIFLMGQRA